MENPRSELVFQVKNNKLMYIPGITKGRHKPKKLDDGFVFGISGIKIQFFNGEPKLTIPDGEDAEIRRVRVKSKGKNIEGVFFQVRIK